MSRTSVGTKLDTGRLRYDLVHDAAEAEEVAVLSFGAIKYDPNNWKLVPEARERYFAALRRHLAAWRSGKPYDDETGLHHLGHALCCLRFLLGLEIEADPSIPHTLPDRFATSLGIARDLRAKREDPKQPVPRETGRDNS